MSLRSKLMAALVILAAASSVIVGAVTYRATRTELRQQVDSSLRAAAIQLSSRPPTGNTPEQQTVRGAVRSLRDFRAPGDIAVQIVGPRGRTVRAGGATLPTTDADLAIASSRNVRESFRNIEVAGVTQRLLTRGIGNRRGAVQAARSLTEVQAVLNGLARRIVTVTLLVSAAAALIGWAVSRQVTRRLIELTTAAEQISSTADPGVQVPVSGTDETGRLGVAFNKMLSALASARGDQQRLVENAGHELRTPLTSLRTNIFALRHADNIPDDQREQILDDLTLETEELTDLINEVVELATDRRNEAPPSNLELGPIVDRAARRASQRANRAVEVKVDGSMVSGREAALARAVSNLVENAMKFDRSVTPISVTCDEGRVTVADSGPGFSEFDVPRVFERFYRADTARGQPGSGLGLSIVAEIVERHGGEVFARNRVGGGAIVGFWIPTISPDSA